VFDAALPYCFRLRRVERRLTIFSALLVLLIPSHGYPQSTSKVTFVGIDLTGMNYYPEKHITEAAVKKEVDGVVAEHGNVIDLATVQDVAIRITSVYRKSGFVFTRAYVPQQRAANGRVEVRLIEGWLSSVDVLDNRRYEQQVLERPFADLKGKTVYSPDMEEAIALLNDYPGLNAFGFYSVGEEPGSTRVNIRVQNERDWTGSIHADNFGSELTGKTRLFTAAEKFNPSGNADRLGVSVLQTFDPDNATYGQIDYDIPVFDKRTKFSMQASTNTFVVKRAVSDGGIEFSGKTHSGELKLTRHIKRGSAMNANWNVGIRRDVSTIDIKNYGNVDLDQETWEGSAGIQWNLLNRLAGNWFGAGADIAAGRYDQINVTGQSRDYYFARGFASYAQSIALMQSTQQLKFDVDWQYTDDLLPAISQYALAGPTRLRGFLPGEFNADSGAVVASTWGFPTWSTAGKNADTRCDVTLSVFAEYGYGVQNIPATGGNDKGTLSDVGASWLFTVGPEISATITVAKPVSYRIDYEEDRASATRAWVELHWRFH